MLNFTISTSGSVGVSNPKTCYPNYEKCDIKLNFMSLLWFFNCKCLWLL